jgi:hypothetical protein
MSHSPAVGATFPVHAANRLGLDYAALASTMPAPPGGIIDVHAHINGPAAAEVYGRAARLYGVRRVYSMTQLEQVEAVRGVLGDMVRFIAVPSYTAADRRHHHGPGFIERIRAFHELGARVVKFWAAPRGREYGREAGDPGLLHLDAPMRIAAMETAASLGMVFMAHVADPDTWFASRYRDASIYGAKRDHYRPLETLADRFPVPWIVAHMGGWPEDLEFLAGLLDRHANLRLDTSAAKWMIRELGRHDRAVLAAFFTRFRGRIHFGSDIVAEDEHLTGGSKATEMLSRANSTAEAFDLYAGRYWALRTMFETAHRGPSPIADPDLAMVDPARHGPMDAPMLSGKSLPPALLRSLYSEATDDLLGRS